MNFDPHRTASQTDFKVLIGFIETDNMKLKCFLTAK